MVSGGNFRLQDKRESRRGGGTMTISASNQYAAMDTSNGIVSRTNMLSSKARSGCFTASTGCLRRAHTRYHHPELLGCLLFTLGIAHHTAYMVLRDDFMKMQPSTVGAVIHTRSNLKT